MVTPDYITRVREILDSPQISDECHGSHQIRPPRVASDPAGPLEPSPKPIVCRKLPSPKYYQEQCLFDMLLVAR
jgi:hypothetical protein